MTKIMIRQVDLRSDDNQLMTTWLEEHPKISIGAIISLKDYMPEVRWTIMKVYPIAHAGHEFDFHRKWDNNDYTKHEGLKI